MNETSFPLREAEVWSKVLIEQLGLLDTSPEDMEMLGTEVVMLGEKEPADTLVLDPMTGRPISLFLVANGNVTHRLGGDTLVTQSFPATPAGHPRELAKLAVEGTQMPLADDVVQFQDDIPDFIWEPVELYSAVVGLVDAEVAVDTLLRAISVAPREVLPTLHAALAMRYDETMSFYEDTRSAPTEWDASGNVIRLGGQSIDED